MAHFTQLGIAANQDKKTEVKPQGKTSPTVSPEEQRPRADTKKPTHKQKTAVLIGSLIATALLGVFVLESGCSKEQDKTATIAMPTQTAASPLPAPVLPASISTPTSAANQPAKKTRQRKLSASTYANPTYGVSFRYPKYDSLKEGDEANLEFDGLGPVEMNFIQSGGTTISAVELPRKLYAGTDFNSAFFNVSVNPKLTSAECEQFAFPETGDQEKDLVATSKAKVGVTEFHAVEGYAEGENKQADVKYYHVFENGSCYEFALGLETAAQTVTDETKPVVKPRVKPVDSNEVFRRLNWILSTVKIQPAAAPDKTVPEVATDTPTAANPAIMEAH
jgi:hypothetical protein